MKNVNIRFDGFYESEHSSKIESMLENYYDSESYDWEKVNYKALQYEYSKYYIDFLNYLIGCDIQFKEVYYPKYYNFETDVIISDASNSDMLKVFQFIKENNLIDDLYQLLKDKTTSKSGYIPFYSYDDLVKSDKKDILFSCMIDVIIEWSNEGQNLWDDYYDFNYLYEIVYNVDFENVA